MNKSGQSQRWWRNPGHSWQPLGIYWGCPVLNDLVYIDKCQQKCLYSSLDFKSPGDKYNPGGSRWGKVAVTIVAAWKYHCQVWRQEVGSSGFVVH